MAKLDGYLPNTGECPVDRGVKLDILYKNGEKSFNCKAMCSLFEQDSDYEGPYVATHWNLWDGYSSIIGWRVS